LKGGKHHEDHSAGTPSREEEGNDEPVIDIQRLPERLRRFIAARLDGGSALGLRLTIDVVLFAAGVWAFSGLLEEVLDNESLVRWDIAVAARFHALATPAGLRAFAIVTQLGAPVVYLVVVAVALLLWRRRERLLLWTWLSANLGGKMLESVIKSTVHRTRPQPTPQYLNFESFSFPSGHSMGATICYVTLAVIVTEMAGWQGRRQLLAYAAALTIVLAVAFSRIYLGVHYPSDVLGGITAGAAWLALCLTTLRIVRWEERARPVGPGSAPASVR
jgi:undecaprenyl-diphosphatase